MKHAATLKLAGIVIATGALLAAPAQARPGRGGKGEGERHGEGMRRLCDEDGSFRREMHERVHNHFRQQHEENRALHDQIRDNTPQEQCTALIDHFGTQHQENLAFGSEQYDLMVTHLEACFAENDVPQEKQDEVLAHVQEKHDERVQHFTECHEGAVTLLQDLSQQEDLTKQELWEALREWRRECRPHGGRGEGRGPGRGGEGHERGGKRGRGRGPGGPPEGDDLI